MSAQTDTQLAEPPIWTGWQNAVINGAYPLRQLLHGTEHSAVFLTDRKDHAGAEAALKIVPIDQVTLAQLSHWKAASELSHPHLLQLFDAGLCQLAGRQFLFVVMEYAHETLSGVLAQRALTPDETRELLPPALAALSFLHDRGLVLGHLKPTNVLVVSDQVKLASDGVRPVGAPRVGILEPSVYDAPEADRAPFSPADDIWALGVTLVESLTLELPRYDQRTAIVQLPDAVPAPFANTVRRCMDRHAEARPSAAELQGRLAATSKAMSSPAAESAGSVAAPASVIPEPAATESIPAATAPVMPAAAMATNPVSPPHVAQSIEPARIPEPLPLSSTVPNRTGRLQAVTAAVAVGLVVVVWSTLRLLHSHSGEPAAPTASVHPLSPPAVTAPSAVTGPTTAVVPQTASTHPAAPPRSAVMVRQLPEVSHSALQSITGRVKVSVAVVVDRSGVVVDTHFKNRGPSAYFASRANQAAKRWKFSATDGPGRREWLLHFEFARSGVTANATEGS